MTKLNYQCSQNAHFYQHRVDTTLNSEQRINALLQYTLPDLLPYHNCHMTGQLDASSETSLYSIGSSDKQSPDVDEPGNEHVTINFPPSRTEASLTQPSTNH